jgi:hypothetical protein
MAFEVCGVNSAKASEAQRMWVTIVSVFEAIRVQIDANGGSALGER